MYQNSEVKYNYPNKLLSKEIEDSLTQQREQFLALMYDLDDDNRLRKATAYLEYKDGQ